MMSFFLLHGDKYTSVTTANSQATVTAPDGVERDVRELVERVRERETLDCSSAEKDVIFYCILKKLITMKNRLHLLTVWWFLVPTLVTVKSAPTVELLSPNDKEYLCTQLANSCVGHIWWQFFHAYFVCMLRNFLLSIQISERTTNVL